MNDRRLMDDKKYPALNEEQSQKLKQLLILFFLDLKKALFFA